MTDSSGLAPPGAGSWDKLVSGSPDLQALQPVKKLVGKEAAAELERKSPPRKVEAGEALKRALEGGARQFGANALRTRAALQAPAEPKLLPEDEAGIRKSHWLTMDGGQVALEKARNRMRNAQAKADYDRKLAASDELFADADEQERRVRQLDLQPGEEYTGYGRAASLLAGVVPGALNMPFEAQEKAIGVLQGGGTVRDAAKAAAIQTPLTFAEWELPRVGGELAGKLLPQAGKVARIAGRLGGSVAGAAAGVPLQAAGDYLATPAGQEKPSLLPSWEQVRQAAPGLLLAGLPGKEKSRLGGEAGRAGSAVEGTARERPATSTNRDGLPVRSGDRVGLGAGMAQDGVTSVHDAAMPESIPALHRSGEQRPFDVRESHDLHERVEKPLLDAGHSYPDAHRAATEVEHARIRQLGFDPNEIEQRLAPHLDKAAHEARAKGNTTADVTGEPYQDSGENRMREDGGEPDPRFVLDRDGGRHTQPEHGRLLGSIATVTAKSDGGGHAVIEPNSGMVLARGATREAADAAAGRLAAQLGRRRLQARIDAEPPLSQQQLRERFQDTHPEGRVGESPAQAAEKLPAEEPAKVEQLSPLRPEVGEERTSGDAAAEAPSESDLRMGSRATPAEQSEPAPPFVLDRDGGRHTQPEHGRLLGKIETVTAKSEDGGHAVIEPNSGMVLARGETREAANQAAARQAAKLGRRRLQARINAASARVQQQLHERHPEARVSGKDGPPPGKLAIQPEPEPEPSAPPGEGRGPFEDIPTPPGGRKEVRNGYAYILDHLGRIRHYYGELTRNPAQKRNKSAQLKAGGQYRRSTDQGGHYGARRFNGPLDEFNHFAQDAGFNNGEYKRLENAWDNAKKAGRRVHVSVIPSFEGDSLRPHRLKVTHWIDGVETAGNYPNESGIEEDRL